MVALKLGNDAPDENLAGEKQERRGGIETCLDPAMGVGVPKKQERRGGIETGSGATPQLGIQCEAGTPWWH